MFKVANFISLPIHISKLYKKFIWNRISKSVEKGKWAKYIIKLMQEILSYKFLFILVFKGTCYML